MTNDEARLLNLETAGFIVDPATNLSTPVIVKGVEEDAVGDITIKVAYVTPVIAVLTAAEVSLTAPVAIDVVATAEVTDGTSEVSGDTSEVAEGTTAIPSSQDTTPIDPTDTSSAQDGTVTQY